MATLRPVSGCVTFTVPRMAPSASVRRGSLAVKPSRSIWMSRILSLICSSDTSISKACPGSLGISARLPMRSAGSAVGTMGVSSTGGAVVRGEALGRRPRSLLPTRSTALQAKQPTAVTSRMPSARATWERRVREAMGHLLSGCRAGAARWPAPTAIRQGRAADLCTP